MKDLEKMKKTANLIDIFLKVGQILLIVCAAITVISEIGAAFAKHAVDSKVSFKVGSMNFIVADGFDTSFYEEVGSKAVVYSIIVCLISLVFMAVGYIFLYFIRKMFVPLKDGRPFDSSMPKYFRIMALVEVIAYPVVTGLSALLSRIVEKQTTELVEKGIIEMTGSGSSNVFSLNFLVLAAFLLLLSYIFEYGAVLQKQSDETL